jgi:hypothetical protein
MKYKRKQFSWSGKHHFPHEILSEKFINICKVTRIGESGARYRILLTKFYLAYFYARERQQIWINNEFLVF